MDRERVVCAGLGVDLLDRAGGQYRFAYAEVAPDWKPPPDPSALPVRGPGDDEFPWVRFTSATLAPASSDVFLAYNGGQDRREWRLERWTIDRVAGTLLAGAFTRLAVDHNRQWSSVLATSPTADALVLGGPHEPLVLRRGPRYEPETLAEDATHVVAATSEDGKQLLTGHEDGTMLLWDIGTRQVIASTTSSDVSGHPFLHPAGRRAH
jgi:hypothetical protein